MIARNSLSVMLLWLMVVGSMTACAAPVAAPAAPAAELGAAAPADMESSLSVLTWWSPESLYVPIGVFEQANPGVTVEQYSSTYDEYWRDLAVLTAAGNLPDTWQVIPLFDLLGEERTQRRSAPLGELYAEDDWEEQFPPNLLSMMQIEGEYLQVPVSIMRRNELRYNADILDAAGIDAQTVKTLTELLEMLELVESHGKRPLCLHPTYLAQFFENTAVGKLGAEGYVRLWSGAPESGDSAVGDAVAVFGQLLNKAHVSEKAVEEFIAGECALLASYPVVDSAFRTAENIDWMAFPGEDVFVTQAVGFSLAQADNPRGMDWLRAVGSKEVQETLAKGGLSICARTDCDDTDFNAYQKWVKDAYENSILTPSYLSGARALDKNTQSLDNILQNFQQGNISESEVVERLLADDGPYCYDCYFWCGILGLPVCVP